MTLQWAANFLLLIPLLGIPPASDTTTTEAHCMFLGKANQNSLYEDGDVVIGGIFPFHHGPVSNPPTFKTKPPPATFRNFLSRPLRWMQTMIFAIAEINQRTDLLPGLKLGFHMRDSCMDDHMAVHELLLLVNGQPQIVDGEDAAARRLNASASDCAAVRRTVSPVVIAGVTSGTSVALMRSLGAFHIPLVASFASCVCLSDKRAFPSFMRTMPSDFFQVKALVRLVSHFGWTWVGVIGVESEYAKSAIQLFLRESVFVGVCTAYTYMIPMSPTPEDLDELLDLIQASNAKVIINFCTDTEMMVILTEVKRRNITDLHFIAGESWSTLTQLWGNFADVLKGTLGFAIQRADAIPGLKQHLFNFNMSSLHKTAFLAELWEETFDCRLSGSVNQHSHRSNYQERSPCSGAESLEDVYSTYGDVSQLRVSFNIYKAVYVVAHALQTMSQCKDGKGPFVNGTCADSKNFKPWQLLHYMRHANFSLLDARVSFGENGDPLAYYDLMNWQRNSDGSLRLVKVGYFDASLPVGSSLVINNSLIQWPSGNQAVTSVCSESCPPGFRMARKKGLPICCFDCIPCAQGEISNETDSLECTICPVHMWSNKARDHCVPKTLEFLSFHEVMGAVLCAVSVSGACISLSILVIFFRHKNTPLVRANNMELSFLLLLFLAICFLVGLLFIGEPSDWLCRIRYPAFGISFALCISCLLAKTGVVLMAFRATLPGSNVMKWFGPNQQRASVLVGTAAQGLICLIWLLTNPPHANTNTGFFSSTIIMECVAGSEVGFWCVLGYIGVLACACLLMAFLARNLPDNFNEAKFITFSMLIFFAVWITFIPVYVSTPGKFTVAVHIFAILASAFGLLFCIFAPKCYIIILKPEKNSKKNIIGH